MTSLGSSPELAVLRNVADPANYDAYMSCQSEALSGTEVSQMIEKMRAVDMNFLGFDLSAVPGFALNLLVLIPVLAGLSALIMCVVQNKINVLQVEQGVFARWGMTVFMIAFSWCILLFLFLPE